MSEFKIVIKVDSSGAVRSAKAVEVQLKRTERQGNKTGNVLKKAFAGVAVGQGVVQATRFLAAFGQEMSTVKAITKATDGEFKQLRDTAIDLGTTTRFTSKQAASGMLFLARSGFKTKQILETIPGVLNLAQAGALDLGRAADITTNILKGFGLATSETARVVDILALASNSANTTVEQMGQAMKFVAPIAAGVRMSLEDTAAAIQVLSNAGIQASMAGTGLRRVIGALEGPTASQEKILNSLGLTTDDVKVSSVGLAGALGAIRSKTNDVGTMLKLFGQRGGPAGEVMAKMASEMTEFGIANAFAGGEAARVAKVMDDNLNGALLRVKSAFQGFLIQLGDVEGVSFMRSALESIAKTFRFLAKNAEGFNNAMKVIAPTILYFVLVTDKATAAIGRLSFAIVSNPFGFLLTVLTTLIASIVLFKDEIKLGGDGLISFGDIFRVTADFIRDAWGGLFGGMFRDFNLFEGGWKNLMSNMMNMFLAMTLTVAQAFDKVAGFFLGLDKASILVIDGINQVFDEGFKKIANSANKWMQEAIMFWVTGINDLADKLHLGDAFKIDDVAFTESFDLIEDKAIITWEKIRAAFDKEMNRDGLENVILGILDEAERRKLEAMRRLGQKEDPTLKPDKVPDLFGPESAGAARDKSKVSFGEYAAMISQETMLLGLNSREMEIQEGLIEANDKILGGLNDSTELMLSNMLREKQLRGEMAAAYDEIKRPMEDMLARQEALNLLHVEGTITLKEYKLAMDELKIASLDLNTDMESGFNRGLLRIKLTMQDLATTAETTLVNAFRGLENAIGDFVTGTEVDFSGMVDSILRDLTRLLAQKALLNLISGGTASAIPGGLPTNPGTGVFGPAFASGGSFRVGGSGGTDSQRVAFNASPNERVTVETPAQQRDKDTAATPNITVLNVTDPDEIPNAMGSAEGERVILNIIMRNRNTIKGSLA